MAGTLALREQIARGNRRVRRTGSRSVVVACAGFAVRLKHDSYRRRWNGCGPSRAYRGWARAGDPTPDAARRAHGGRGARASRRRAPGARTTGACGAFGDHAGTTAAGRTFDGQAPATGALGGRTTGGRGCPGVSSCRVEHSRRCRTQAEAPATAPDRARVDDRFARRRGGGVVDVPGQHWVRASLWS